MMFEYAFGLMPEGALIRKAVAASLEENVVTEDISKEHAKSTSQVGDWIAQFIEKA